MMDKINYMEVVFTCTPNNETSTSVLAMYLAEIGYDSFIDTDNGSTAYITEELYDESKLKDAIADLPIEVEISYIANKLESQNWNEEWEKNYFSPIVIEDQCVIKSSFHKDVPDCKYTIIINPKMAFGTGHHQTTVLMLKEILKVDFTGQKVLDMGCGTAILGVLASMRGAESVLAIDIDEWAYDNAIENLSLNNISNVEVQIGGANLLGSQTFDTIIANINRNILLEDIKHYAAVLNSGGTLYMSGFYTEDIAVIEQEANKYELGLEYNTERDNWAGVKFVKK